MLFQLEIIMLILSSCFGISITLACYIRWLLSLTVSNDVLYRVFSMHMISYIPICKEHISIWIKIPITKGQLSFYCQFTISWTIALIIIYWFILLFLLLVSKTLYTCWVSSIHILEKFCLTFASYMFVHFHVMFVLYSKI